jgi:hypothetical protein
LRDSIWVLFFADVRRSLQHAQRNELAVGWNATEIRDFKAETTDNTRDGSQFLVWHVQKFLEEFEFVHQFHRRRMDRVPSEIPKEIFMLFEDCHSYSLAREQVAEHHACGTTTHDATRSLMGACQSRYLRNTHCIGQNNEGCRPAGILRYQG